MSHPSTPTNTLTMYPPSSLGYPQFIAPFGDDSGRRAAVRVFFGDKDTRYIPPEQLDMPALLERWDVLQNYDRPAGLSRPEFLPSLVDLDPQVTELPRAGTSLELPFHMLLTALSAAEFASAASEDAPPFKGLISSIWSSTILEEDLNSAEVIAQFERFIDHCTIDVSGRRNLFFAPTALRQHLEARALELLDELDMCTHDFDDTLANLRPIFFEHEQATNHLLFFEPHTTSLNVLLEVFSSCWIEAIELSAPASSSSNHSGRHERELAPGVLLGERYEITSRIGSGGFAIVYEAQDKKVSRQVAIKVIDLERHMDERSRQSYIKRFEREARLAVSVRHPCVVEVLDLGVTSEEVPYIVMERLEGWDLDTQSHRHGPMNPKRIIPLFIQALEGLGCAHEKDIVHKDLKPSNIFLKNPGKRHEQLCILDFGVARRINTATARLTHTDSAFGTPHYMAPEYSTSQIATPALDVYQMGLILVEMLMGEPVVSHPEPVAAMFQHVRGDLSIPEALLESPIGDILKCALTTNHLLRYQDAFEFADALRKVENILDVPMLEAGARRVSLNVLALRDPENEARETPVMGANLLTTDRYRSSRNVKVPHLDPFVQTPLLEPEPLHEISPFASTLPFDDIAVQLAEFDPSAPISEEASARRAPPQLITRLLPDIVEPAQEDDAPGETEEAVSTHLLDYSSKKPYVLLISLLFIALFITIIALFQNKQQLQNLANSTVLKPEVVTEYDRKLAELRAQAAELEDLLNDGEIEEVLAQVELMDQSDVRLTPDEVDDVKVIVNAARQERVNREILNRALQLVNAREHERAIDKLDTMASRSVFWHHPDTLQVLDRSKIVLLPEVQRLRGSNDYESARKLVEKLVMHDPQSTELMYLLMDINNDIASQPPAMLQLPLTDMGDNEMGDNEMGEERRDPPREESIDEK